MNNETMLVVRNDESKLLCEANNVEWRKTMDFLEADQKHSHNQLRINHILQMLI